MDNLVKLTDLSHNSYWIGTSKLISWVSFDFRKRRIALSAIKSGNVSQLRSWVIEGSKDGRKWSVMYERQNNNVVGGGLKEAHFTLAQSSELYNQLRLRLSDENHGGDHKIAFKYIEFFGTVYSQ